MLKTHTFLLLFIAASLNLYARVWSPDTLLGDGFEATIIDQGKDYSGEICSTVIRKQAQKPAICGVLYVHGFNDYFFQAEMANKFTAENYSFYAVDLRKYGRSLRNWQKPYQVRNMAEYFADLDSAVSVMKENGVRNIILMGHSTGGLTCALYMAEVRKPEIRALVLNSPFLDWNLSPMLEAVAVPSIAVLGKYFPDVRIPQGGGTSYGESLLEGYSGEWNFDTTLKVLKSPDVDAGWIRAIDVAQHRLQNMLMPIKVPVLLMHSARSVSSGNGGDAVLDVRDIGRYGRNLACNLTIMVVDGGLHDLVLSRKKVREQLYGKLFKWLETNHLQGQLYQ